MKHDWSKFGLMQIRQIAESGNFRDYGDDDLQSMISRCNSWSLLGGMEAKVAQNAKDLLLRALDLRRAEADRRRQETTETERQQKHTALEKEKLEQLVGIKGEATHIGGHVKSLDNRVTGIAERLETTEDHVRGIHKEAKRATLIGVAALVVAVISLIWELFRSAGQKEATAAQTSSQPKSGITNSTPGVSATRTNGP